MGETQPEESTPEKTVGARGEETPIVTGMEINLGDFTRTQGLLKSLRLTLDNQIVVQVEDLGRHNGSLRGQDQNAGIPHRSTCPIRHDA